MTDTIRFALIGAGNVAKIHAAAINAIANSQLTVVCSRGQARGEELAQQNGAVWVQDYHEAVNRNDVDAVIICTPSGTHGEIAEAAAHAGKHLLVEKPLEITLPRIDAMLKIADQYGIRLGCVFQSRMREGVQAAKVAIDAGRLGKLIAANAFVPWSRSAAYYQDSWRGTWELDGGGALMNQSIHSIDLLQWLAGDVASVYAHAEALVHSIQAEDTATALLRFANGAQGVIQGMTSLYHGQMARIEIYGSKGSIVLEDGRVILWKLADATDEEAERLTGLDTWKGSGASDPTSIGFYLHQQQIEQFIAALQDKNAPFISGADGRKAVEIVRAIYHSARHQQPVTLPFADNL
jgi:UDP-N-acetyl-2-amino-2-deoxyglucuronate dehydrogenase